MLKLTYTEFGLHLEQSNISVENFVQDRVILALRCGYSLYIEPGRAAFLLPADLPGLVQLKTTASSKRGDRGTQLNLTAVDAEFVEVSLKGTWLAGNAEADEGTFITAITQEIELFIYKLWQIAQSQASFLI